MGEMVSRLVPVLLALCLLALASAAPATAASERARVARVTQAKKQLSKLRKRRAAACRHRHGRRQVRRCRALRAKVRRQARHVRRLRATVEASTPAARGGTGGAAAPRSGASTGSAATGPTLYVSPRGSDTAAGTAAAPLATLTAALARAGGGERIVVAPGSYPRATDDRVRTKTVTVTGPGGGGATVAGMRVQGGQELTISGLSFTSGVSVRYHPTRMKGQPARNIAFTNDDFTAPSGSGCLEARNAVQNLSVTASRIHDCVTGFGAGAGGPIPQSRGLRLVGNRFEHFSGDAIQFGQWDDVRITNNVITGMRDPAEVVHNDGIQLTGNDRGVTIARNRITDSRSQLIFIQDAVGPIDDVTVENNLVAIAGAVAIQSQGATHARFVNNTVWRGKDGGLWLRQGFARAGEPVSVPTDTVVVDNVLSSYRRMEGAATTTAAGNVGSCMSWEKPHTDAAAGWSCLPDVGFVAASSGDYRLRADAPARPFGSGLGGQATDIDGAARTSHAPGAFR